MSWKKTLYDNADSPNKGLAKVSERLWRTRCPFSMRRSIRITGFNNFSGAVAIASSYRGAGEQTQAFFKQTSCAKAFRRVGEYFRFASSTNSVRCLQFDSSIVDRS
jgi:hypothetical protein